MHFLQNLTKPQSSFVLQKIWPDFYPLAYILFALFGFIEHLKLLEARRNYCDPAAKKCNFQNKPYLSSVILMISIFCELLRKTQSAINMTIFGNSFLSLHLKKCWFSMPTKSLGNAQFQGKIATFPVRQIDVIFCHRVFRGKNQNCSKNAFDSLLWFVLQFKALFVVLLD